MKERSEKTGGDNARLAERQRNEALEAVATARIRIEVLQPLSMKLPRLICPPAGPWLPSKSCNRRLLQQAGRSSGDVVSPTITGPETRRRHRPNGSGKTTLLAVITGSLQPCAGSARVQTSFARPAG